MQTVGAGTGSPRPGGGGAGVCAQRGTPAQRSDYFIQPFFLNQKTMAATTAIITAQVQ